VTVNLTKRTAVHDKNKYLSKFSKLRLFVFPPFKSIACFHFSRNPIVFKRVTYTPKIKNKASRKFVFPVSSRNFFAGSVGGNTLIQTNKKRPKTAAVYRFRLDSRVNNGRENVPVPVHIRAYDKSATGTRNSIYIYMYLIVGSKKGLRVIRAVLISALIASRPVFFELSAWPPRLLSPTYPTRCRVREKTDAITHRRATATRKVAPSPLFRTGKDVCSTPEARFERSRRSVQYRGRPKIVANFPFN